jgi:hypothetical protein
VDLGHLEAWIHRSVDNHEFTVLPQGVDEPPEIRELLLAHGEVDCPVQVAAPQAGWWLRPRIFALSRYPRVLECVEQA